jgi:L-gulonolactone oxidase
VGIYRTLRAWGLNAVNTLVYVGSGGNKTLHEGRYELGRWTNWNRETAAWPRVFAQPTTEQEICRVVREAKRLRVVGAGHTFGDQPVSNDTMLSLDKYNAVVSVDQERRRLRVQAGMRLRDLQRVLYDHGWALPAAGSTDAQSLGGLVANDVHGTGRDHAFLSESILALRVVDAAGVARDYVRGDEMFTASIGTSGMTGVVIEIELEAVPLYNVAKSIAVLEAASLRQRIGELLEENDHLSFYFLGGVQTPRARANIWNRTVKPVSQFAHAKKIKLEVEDMVFSGYLLGFASSIHQIDRTAKVGFQLEEKFDSDVVVLPATEAFARKLFYDHDEIEYGIPFERWWDCLEEVRAYLLARRFFTIVEVRFSPNVSPALIGPGVGRRTCYIELAPPLSEDCREVFADVEKIFWKYDGQVHLGKRTLAGPKDMRRMYGERYERLLAAWRQQDPTAKFVNDFVARTLVTDENEGGYVLSPTGAGTAERVIR